MRRAKWCELDGSMGRKNSLIAGLAGENRQKIATAEDGFLLKLMYCISAHVFSSKVTAC